MNVTSHPLHNLLSSNEIIPRIREYFPQILRIEQTLTRRQSTPSRRFPGMNETNPGNQVLHVHRCNPSKIRVVPLNRVSLWRGERNFYSRGKDNFLQGGWIKELHTFDKVERIDFSKIDLFCHRDSFGILWNTLKDNRLEVFVSIQWLFRECFSRNEIFKT